MTSSEPSTQSSWKTLLAPGSTPVMKWVPLRNLASPARTPTTAVVPGTSRSGSSTLIGIGE